MMDALEAFENCVVMVYNTYSVSLFGRLLGGTGPALTYLFLLVLHPQHAYSVFRHN